MDAVTAASVAMVPVVASVGHSRGGSHGGSHGSHVLVVNVVVFSHLFVEPTTHKVLDDVARSL
uniref:Uncharacterized protein n=1 Tax=Anguilla anguilla TaxID=7936 RepID=A0A0E9XKZ4_ANGAN